MSEKIRYVYWLLTHYIKFQPLTIHVYERHSHVCHDLDRILMLTSRKLNLLLVEETERKINLQNEREKEKKPW